jgi:U3 small nucleolar RNA-associated protein 14
MDTSPCPESSIPWTKATSKRGRSPREEPTREAKYQLERMNPATDDEQENDITENTNMVDWQLVRGIKRRKSKSSRTTIPLNQQYQQAIDMNC